MAQKHGKSWTLKSGGSNLGALQKFTPMVGVTTQDKAYVSLQATLAPLSRSGVGMRETIDVDVPDCQ